MPDNELYIDNARQLYNLQPFKGCKTSLVALQLQPIESLIKLAYVASSDLLTVWVS